MTEIAGRVAMISGGASGIGLSMGEALAREGASVILADIDLDAAEAAAARLCQSGFSAAATALDVRSPDSWRNALDSALQSAGPISIFCNNAGVSGTPGSVMRENSSAQWEWVRAINLDGALHGLRCIVPHMVDHRQGGHIVNTSSMAGLLAYADTADYTATKYAIVGVSEVLMQELGVHGIRVSVLCPGNFRTGIFQNSRRSHAEIFGEAADAGDSSELEADVAGGADPELAGKFVVNAILEDREYIFTHPEFGSEIERKFKAICDDFSWSRKILLGLQPQLKRN